MMRTTRTPIKSPCNGVCDIDPRSGLCMSCRRTLDEIALWSSYTSTDRDRILGELAARPVPASDNPQGRGAHRRAMN